MREQATESLTHAGQVGEEVTRLGGKVSLAIGELGGSHHAAVDEMMKEMLIHERAGIEQYHRLHDSPDRIGDHTSVQLAWATDVVEPVPGRLCGSESE